MASIDTEWKSKCPSTSTFTSPPPATPSTTWAAAAWACAIICCEDPKNPIDLEEVCRFLRERGLMNQKLPEQLELVDVLPRNASGKVLKHELRKRYEKA